MSGLLGLKRIDQCVVMVKVFKRDVQIGFSGINYSDFVSREEELRNRSRRRSRIIRFSWRSARRLRHVIRNTEDIWRAFVTLTYSGNFPLNGRETKTHLNAFLQYLRRKRVKYVWVLEFQSRGAPHFHIIASGEIPKDEVAERWYRIVGSGDERHLRGGTRVEAIKSKGHLYGYLYNYIKKLDQKKPPETFEDIGRFWGSSRNILIYEGFDRIGHFYKLVWGIKLMRNWYKAHLRMFGIKWRWKGKGLIALDEASLVKQIMSLQL
jgi:hypothetical protein